MLTDSYSLNCPYCGESIDITLDYSVESQSYIEDCSVCCRPIEIAVVIIEGKAQVVARRDND